MFENGFCFVCSTCAFPLYIPSSAFQELDRNSENTTFIFLKDLKYGNVYAHCPRCLNHLFTGPLKK